MTGVAAITRLAPAKLNLFLHVVGRRDDGMHLLQSLVCFADTGDRIRVTAEPVAAGSASSGNAGEASVRLTLDGPFAAAIDGATEDNLVVRSARALAAFAGRADWHLDIDLQKNLPVAAGIGGGSADAAATLSALIARWDLDPSAVMHSGVPLALGADVPSCLTAQPVLMEGIGEHLTPVTIPADVGVVLVNPRVPLSTPAIFRDYRANEGFSPERAALAADLSRAAATDREAWFDLLCTMCNDLERPARRLCPSVAVVLSALADLPGTVLVRMSGSGATCFALFPRLDDARNAAATLAGAHPDWWIRDAQLMA